MGSIVWMDIRTIWDPLFGCLYNMRFIVCWVHGKFSGLKGQLTKATNFVCSQCSSGAVADRNNEEKVMLAGSNLEVGDKFCYLGDMLDAGGGAESSTVTRVRSGWKKFR